MFFNSKFKKYIFFLLFLAIGITIISFLLNTNIKFYNPIVFVLNMIGFNSINNNFILNNHHIIINNFCAGIFSIALFLLITFSPISKTKINQTKLKLSIFFSVILYIINFIRILLLFFLSGFVNLEIAHMFGWFFMGFFIFLFWYVIEFGFK